MGVRKRDRHRVVNAVDNRRGGSDRSLGMAGNCEWNMLVAGEMKRLVGGRSKLVRYFHQSPPPGRHCRPAAAGGGLNAPAGIKARPPERPPSSVRDR